MAEEEQNEEEFTEGEKLSIETALAEIKMASQDLYELLGWVATHEDYSPDEFTDLLGIVYSYARAKNPSLEGEATEETTDGEST